MNSLLQLLDILTALLGRWLKQERAREVQENYDQNHSDPQGRFAARFGAASGQLPDNTNPAGKLPATHPQADMEPRQ